MVDKMEISNFEWICALPYLWQQSLVNIKEVIKYGLFNSRD